MVAGLVRVRLEAGWAMSTVWLPKARRLAKVLAAAPRTTWLRADEVWT